jgi:uncharacterized protein (TIGR01777 family)
MNASVPRIAITGASGLVGKALSDSLEAEGWTVMRLVRRSRVGPGEVTWDPAASHVDLEPLEGIDAVVNLAGENVGSGRWTRAKKQRIYASRVDGTTTLANALARLERRPAVLISASAVGIYGNRGADTVDESSALGETFLAEVCRAWERATEPASAAGIRVARLRIGLVVSRQGGVLARMLPAFTLGLGGRLGSGEQYMSWITMRDLVKVVDFALANESVTGAVNVVAPGAVTNAEFTRALGSVLSRPTWLWVPALALRLGVGELAEELLGGQRVVPRVLDQAGFQFRDREIGAALHWALKEGERPSW